MTGSYGLFQMLPAQGFGRGPESPAAPSAGTQSPERSQAVTEALRAAYEESQYQRYLDAQRREHNAALGWADPDHDILADIRQARREYEADTGPHVSEPLRLKKTEPDARRARLEQRCARAVVVAQSLRWRLW